MSTWIKAEPAVTYSHDQVIAHIAWWRNGKRFLSFSMAAGENVKQALCRWMDNVTWLVISKPDGYTPGEFLIECKMLAERL